MISLTSSITRARASSARTKTISKQSIAFEIKSQVSGISWPLKTTSRPKGVMITHRNAYMNVVGTLLHVPMRMADRYLWTLPMFHANGWTFVWNVTAVGAAHICLRKVDPAKVFETISAEHVSLLCAA